MLINIRNLMLMLISASTFSVFFKFSLIIQMHFQMSQMKERQPGWAEITPEEILAHLTQEGFWMNFPKFSLASLHCCKLLHTGTDKLPSI